MCEYLPVGRVVYETVAAKSSTWSLPMDSVKEYSVPNPLHPSEAKGQSAAEAVFAKTRSVLTANTQNCIESKSNKISTTKTRRMSEVMDL